MKKILKVFLAKAFAPIAAKIGFQKIPVEHKELYHKNSLLNNFYSILKQINFIPQHIVDVGANHGYWTREALNFFPDSYYTLFEPQESMRDSIKDILETNTKVRFHAIGVGEKSGTFTFTIVDRDDSCSFIYNESEAKLMGYHQIDVPVVALNDFIPAAKLPIPDIIKIDAEGLDLQVLQGADTFFGTTEIFMVEASVMNNLYENTSVRVINFMNDHDYRLFDITDLNRTEKDGALWLLELVFIKKDGHIDQAITSYN